MRIKKPWSDDFANPLRAMSPNILEKSAQKKLKPVRLRKPDLLRRRKFYLGIFILSIIQMPCIPSHKDRVVIMVIGYGASIGIQKRPLTAGSSAKIHRAV